MTKYFAVNYGETEMVDGRKSMTALAKEEAIAVSGLIKSALSSGEAVVVMAYEKGPAKECADIISSRLACQIISNNALCRPTHQGSAIMASIKAGVKAYQNPDVCVVIASEQICDFISTRLNIHSGDVEQPPAFDELISVYGEEDLFGEEFGVEEGYYD